MTLILRYTDRPHWQLLGGAGACLVSLCVVVGSFGKGPLVRVVLLGGAG